MIIHHFEGYGFTFTEDRGTAIVCVAVKPHTHVLIGDTLEEFISNPGAF